MVRETFLRSDMCGACQYDRRWHSKAVPMLLMVLCGCWLGFGAMAAPTQSDLQIEGDVPQRVVDLLDSTIRGSLAGHSIPGLMVGFSIGSDATGILSYGLSNLETQTPLASTDAFYIGSATKMFTAAGILQLIDQGLMDVDECISQFLDPCPAAWRDVTIEHLLTHTSGIPSYISTDAGQNLRWTTEPVDLGAILGILEGLPMDFVPGRGWHYTNSNFLLLGYILEAVAGASYGSYLTTNLCGPLAMMHTGYDIQTRPEHLVTAYRLPDEPNATFEIYPLPNPSLVHGAGGIHSTMGDLLRWLPGLFANDVLALEWVQFATTPAFSARALPTGDQYGHGFMVWAEGVGDLPVRVGHLGNIHGHLCFPLFFPEEEVGLVLYSNSYDLLRVLMGRSATSMQSTERPLHERLAAILLDAAAAMDVPTPTP